MNKWTYRVRLFDNSVSIQPDTRIAGKAATRSTNYFQLGNAYRGINDRLEK